jgi:polysaccharide biosynthesis transport protein
MSGAASNSAHPVESTVHASNARSPEARFDLWRTVHRSLRGRYRITFLLATAGAMLGAWLGGMFGQRLYSATGLVRIASVMPAVMRETDQNRPIAMFEGYIQAQRDLIASPENIQAALEGSVWQRPSLAKRAPSAEEFARGLKVETRQKSDHIRVTYTSRDPVVSSAAVQSVIEAYSVTFEREQARTEGAREGQLLARLDALRGELDELRKESDAVAGGQTAEEIQALYTAAAERSRKLRSALGDVQATLAGAPSALGQHARAEQSPREMVAAELLRVNVAELGRIEIELERVRIRGYQPGHPQVVRLEAALAQYRERVLRYTEECEQWRSRRGDEASDMTLAEREAKLVAVSKESSDELRRLSLAGDAMKILEDKAKKTRENIAATEARLDALRTEASAGSRLSIVSGGEKPMTAAIDNRHKMTAAGLVVGMAGPLAAMVLIGAVRYRYRFGDDLAGDLHGRAGMVAVLPRMVVDSHLGPASANCIHALRVRLQPNEQGKPRVYLVTSNATGDGKSSIAIALGLSFMAAGYRTLLVDADIASRHLSVEFGADAQAGLMEAVDGAEPNVLRMPTGLHFLAAGRGAAQRAFRLSPPGMARLLTHVRDRFDVIIVDGDPIVHGFSSSLLAPNVDGVLLAASAGVERIAMLRTVRQVGALGGMLVAAILNHVVEGNFGAASDETYPAFVRDAKLAPRLQRFGPLVASMMRSIGYSRERDLEVALSNTEVERRPHAAADENRREAA